LLTLHGKTTKGGQNIEWSYNGYIILIIRGVDVMSFRRTFMPPHSARNFSCSGEGAYPLLFVCNSLLNSLLRESRELAYNMLKSRQKLEPLIFKIPCSQNCGTTGFRMSEATARPYDKIHLMLLKGALVAAVMHEGLWPTNPPQEAENKKSLLFSLFSGNLFLLRSDNPQVTPPLSPVMGFVRVFQTGEPRWPFMHQASIRKSLNFNP
jgi:hypothetical protein